MASKKPRVPALVLITADEELSTALPLLSSLFAQSIHVGFGDSVLLLRLRAAPDNGAPNPEPAFQIEHIPGRPDTLHLDLPAEGRSAAGLLSRVLREHSNKYAYTFFDLGQIQNGCIDEILRQIVNEAEPLGLVLRHASFTQKKREARLPAAFSTLRIDMLQKQAPHISEGSLRARAASFYQSLAPHGQRIIGTRKECRGSYYPSSRSAEFCRVLLGPGEILKYQNGHPLDAIDIGQFPKEMVDSISRAARAFTDRRVGLALGGSGAWGYAHIALIEDLLNEGVPIDLIAGVSSGSLMGAYYCALGREGLSRAVERGPLFSRLVLLSAISSAAIEWTVEMDLGRRPLESLETVFLPVATNLKEGRPEVIHNNTIGFGVRASSSAPGIFTPTPAEDAVYVDGAVTDNVPLLLVERMGADLSVASNPLPPPLNRNIKLPKTPIESFLKGVNPVARATDFLASFSLMFHDAGQHEPRENRIIFEPPAADLPLLGTFEFERAQEIIQMVRAQRAYKETVRRTALMWEKLKRPQSSRSMQ